MVWGSGSSALLRRLLAPALGLVMATAACGSHTATTAFNGAELSKPLALPVVTLTDTAGQPFNVAARARGKLALYYFGYTHCPDVCPTTMADIARALDLLTPALRSRVQVVFVSTDPAHDTLPVIREWLNNFNPAFIGLRGGLAQVQAFAGQLGVEVDPATVSAGGVVSETHAAQVLAFSPQDERSHLVWLPGTTITGYAQDMRALLAGKT